ncbi:hypothetical protein [Clostridium polynesiense]|uniref:hypothetical protein n=1 Tax=Clostridium polynesiense TaxID=1325933 RepID=UPI0005911A1C|nr:hypothetical protein [Clostridium polynesiense]
MKTKRLINIVGIIFLSALLGFYSSKINTTLFILQNLDQDSLKSVIDTIIIPYIKIIRVIGIIFSSVAMAGLMINIRCNSQDRSIFKENINN